MYSMSDLTKEIAGFIDAKVKQGIHCHPKWVTDQILANHEMIEGEDIDFYFCVARNTIYDQVKRRISQFKLTPEKGSQTNLQLVLPGFARLQVAYVIESEGESIAVPLKKMCYSQRQAKRAELIAMGNGCFQHAEELRRYDEEHPNPDPQPQDKLAV